MPNSKYLGYPFVVDARQLMQNAFNYLKAKIPGWQPSEGQLDVWMIEALAGEAADIGTLVSQVPKAIFRYFGPLVGITPIGASSAQVTSTWYLTDTDGHTIPAGTQVAIADSSGNRIPFTVLTDVVVLPGASQTGANAVSLIATFPGTDANNLGTPGGAVTLIDTLAWVDHITQSAATSGGTDAETDDEFLDRLSLELQTLSPRPILPNDFAILARNVSGVQRAVAVDGYNPGDNTFNNERMVTVVAVDSAGVAVGSSVKTAIQAYLDSMRELNFVVNTLDPVSSQVDVTVHYHTLPGYTVADVQTAVVDAITDYLDPAKWGIDRQGDSLTDPTTWNNLTVIRFTDLVAVIKNVQGVDYISAGYPTIGLHGGAMSAADLNLTGVVPLPSPTTITAVGTG